MSPVACRNRLAKAWRRSWHRNGTPARRAIRAKLLAKVCMPLAVMVPEHVGRGDVPRCADQCADGGVAERHDPWA